MPVQALHWPARRCTSDRSRSSWYAAVLGVITHLFVILYEERVLAETFGLDTTRIAGRSDAGCLAYDESDRMNVTRYETADAFLRGRPAAADAGRS